MAVSLSVGLCGNRKPVESQLSTGYWCVSWTTSKLLHCCSRRLDLLVCGTGKAAERLMEEVAFTGGPERVERL